MFPYSSINYKAKIQHNTDLTVSFLVALGEKLEHDEKKCHRGGSLLVGIGPEPVLPYPGLQQEHAPWIAASALHRPIYNIAFLHILRLDEDLQQDNNEERGSIAG
ncbi:hypothetical protein E2C01_040131 [Portunus trituberculatus]|uniref:Uncharacterized protein n=1 Tax=Portunus trituberculatus TaxID=210409 RepID=A0A5B7FGJ9_PORTR|nr:hypothetical protein [Portunus trituberculatus]